MVQIRALEPNVVPIYNMGYVLRVKILIHIQKYIKATTWFSSQLSASRGRRLPACNLYLKGGFHDGVSYAQ